MDNKEVIEGRALSAIGYLGILFLVPLLVHKENDFSQFHAKQGYLLFITFLAAWVLFLILALVLGQLIPIALVTTIIVNVSWFIRLCLLILMVLGIVKAIHGEYWKMPIIGRFSRRLKF